MSGCAGTGANQVPQDTTNIDSDLARFVEGDQSLQELIEFPDVEDDVFADVYCRASILADGRVSSNNCFPSDNVDQSYRIAVERALTSARLTPAIINGEPHPVSLRYRVVFFRKGGAAEVGVYSNWGRDVDRFGLDYEAPQRYTHFYLPRACRPNYRTMAIVLTMTIGTAGELASKIVDESSGVILRRHCVGMIKDILEKAKYIPARHDGRKVEATHFEVWGPYDQIRVNQPYLDAN